MKMGLPNMNLFTMAKRRASAIDGEYLRKARRLDRQYLHVPDIVQVPIELKLGGFDNVRGLVFGAWGRPLRMCRLAREARMVGGGLFGFTGQRSKNTTCRNLLISCVPWPLRP